jgi:hypothetical protein
MTTDRFDIEIIYARAKQKVNYGRNAYSQRHDMGILGTTIRVIRRGNRFAG